MQQIINIPSYVLMFSILLALELLYFRIADKYGIIDKPNARSSHSQITIRGGGIIFPLALLMTAFITNFPWLILLSVLLVAVISFIDDIRPLTQLTRMGVHFLSIVLICYHVFFNSSLHVNYGWYILPIVCISLIGWTNMFNFMDGINGITVLYSLVTLFSLLFSGTESTYLSILIISCLIFSFFNVRKKASCFAGDVGSVSMALILGYFVLIKIIETGQISFLFFFAVYGVDGGLTILNRLRKKENIFKAHRSHLYQYLANEKKLPHVLVSGIYAMVQLLINIIVIYLISINEMNTVEIITILFVLFTLYLSVRYWATKDKRLN